MVSGSGLRLGVTRTSGMLLAEIAVGLKVRQGHQSMSCRAEACQCCCLRIQPHRVFHVGWPLKTLKDFSGTFLLGCIRFDQEFLLDLIRSLSWI